MKRLSTLLFTAVLAFGLVLTGCDSSGGSASGDSGSLELRMSGSSSSTATTLSAESGALTVKEALVTITEVAVVTTEDSAEGEATDTEDGVQALTDEDFEVDLKRLEAGLDTALAEIDIPAGTYGQVRLIVDGEASVTFEDGTQRNVMIASGEQTGLKVNFNPFTIDSADDRVEVSINWDVAKSIKGSTQGNLVITPAINDATVNVISGSDDDDDGGSEG